MNATSTLDIISNKSSQDLLASLLAETAKANHEIRCAERDIQKAQGRIAFSLFIINQLIQRKGD